MSVGVSAARQATRALRNTGNINETRTHIQLRDLPLAAVQADIRRMLAASQVEHVQDVVLDYHQFRPTGRAYLAFRTPADMRTALQRLRGAALASIPVTALPASAPTLPVPPRVRLSAPEYPPDAARAGNGPRAGLAGEGRSVLLEGVPGFLGPETVRARLGAFRLAGGHDVYPALRFRRTAAREREQAVVVHLAAEADAHRLVREWHLTSQFTDREKSQYTTRARLIN